MAANARASCLTCDPSPPTEPHVGGDALASSRRSKSAKRTRSESTVASSSLSWKEPGHGRLEEDNGTVGLDRTIGVFARRDE